eukprot:1575657-Rhodomonas_salina.1
MPTNLGPLALLLACCVALALLLACCVGLSSLAWTFSPSARVSCWLLMRRTLLVLVLVSIEHDQCPLVGGCFEKKSAAIPGSTASEWE